MVFETTAYADSAIKPTSLLDHKKADPKTSRLWLAISPLGHEDCIAASQKLDGSVSRFGHARPVFGCAGSGRTETMTV